jgi:hypothetical protein
LGHHRQLLLNASGIATRNRDAHPADIDAGLARTLANVRYFVHPQRVMDRGRVDEVLEHICSAEPLLPGG